MAHESRSDVVGRRSEGDGEGLLGLSSVESPGLATRGWFVRTDPQECCEIPILYALERLHAKLSGREVIVPDR